MCYVTMMLLWTEKSAGESKAADMNRRREACSETFDYGTNFFRSEITSASDQYAFFSVPYDKSWHATVNGEPVEILKINGLMAVPVSAGLQFHPISLFPHPVVDWHRSEHFQPDSFPDLCEVPAKSRGALRSGRTDHSFDRQKGQHTILCACPFYLCISQSSICCFDHW